MTFVDMVELIAIIILLASLIGIGIILYRKIPDLKRLEKLEEKENPERLFPKVLFKIKDSRLLKSNFHFDSTQHRFETFLQKLLSRIKVLTMRIENKISGYLQRLRERAQQRKKLKEDEYWQKLKESVNFKKKKEK